MTTFEQAFSDTERAADSALKSAGVVNRHARALMRAAKAGNIAAVKRAQSDLDEAMKALRQEVDNANSVWPFHEDEEERYLQDGYADELIAAAQDAGLSVYKQDAALISYPSIVRILPGGPRRSDRPQAGARHQAVPSGGDAAEESAQAERLFAGAILGIAVRGIFRHNKRIEIRRGHDRRKRSHRTPRADLRCDDVSARNQPRVWAQRLRARPLRHRNRRSPRHAARLPRGLPFVHRNAAAQRRRVRIHRAGRAADYLLRRQVQRGSE